MRANGLSFDLDSVRARLPGHRVDWFESVGSTMIEARQPLVARRIVGAEYQTAGVGRHGRTWHSPAGEGLYFSMVLAVAPVPMITLALGLAVREAIGAGDLRWPNDLLIGGRKCAGILAQAEGSNVIAGIGINVSQREFPEGLDTPATSLALEGIEISREDLLVSLVPRIDEWVARPADTILKAFDPYARGQRVRAGEVTGITAGLDPNGFLRVRDDSGVEHTILAGGVRAV